MSRYLPGTRVVLCTLKNGASYATELRGTIISTRKSLVSLNYWTSKKVLMLTVIFDTGEKLEDEAGNFQLEEFFDEHIPF